MSTPRNNAEKQTIGDEKHNGKAIQLLIIDDLPDNRKLLRMDLEDEIPHVEVYEAENGPDGLQLMREHEFSIVICDILMPEMDGFEVLQHARTTPEGEATPFLFLSALRQPETIKKGLEMGAVDFLTKPYDVDELVFKVRNLSRIKHLQDELRASREHLMEANERLKEMNSEKNRVMQIVSHDLRSPLAGIKGLAHILHTQANEIDAKTIAELSKTIFETSNTLSRLVNDLLNITRIESSNQTQLEVAECDLCVLIRQSIRTFEKLAAHKQIALTFYCEGPLRAEVDEPKLAQVFNNLISNAIKFTPAEGSIQLRAFFDERYNRISCEVRDTGIGIPEDLLPVLFEKFGKHQRFGTDGERGVGLGLPIVKSFVELHGGSIEFQSEENKGTTARLTLPLKQSA